MKLWLVRFLAGDVPVGGVFTRADTFLEALHRCDERNLIPAGTAAMDEVITVPVDAQWRDRLLTPEQIRAVLGEES